MAQIRKRALDIHEDAKQYQRSMHLRFESKAFWSDFQRELKVDKTGAAIILDICSSAGAVHYSRNCQHYSQPVRYQNPLYTWRKVTSQVDYLENLGLIEHEKRPAGRRGWQSTIEATEELRNICARITGGQRLMIEKPRELILLRDENRKLIDYQDTQVIHRQRRFLDRYNEALNGAEINPAILAPVVRIFNRNMKRGGRFYAMGTSWQNMKSEARKNLQIGGEPVVELDYATLHPAILYAWADAPLPADCYDLDGWPRKLVKVAMLTLINAPTRGKARLSIANSKHMAGIVELGSQEALRATDRLIDAIKHKHKPIADKFHSDAGAQLMLIDASIAQTVMNLMLMEGIVVLCVHDSFMVQASKAEKLEEAMMEAAYDTGLFAMTVEQK